MRSKGFNPATLSKRMSKSPVAGGSPSTNVTAGDVPAKNPSVTPAKEGKFTPESWAAAGKTGKRPDHSFTQGPPSFARKPRGGNPLPALGGRVPKKDFLNRSQASEAKKALSPRLNALSKRLNKGK